MLLLADLEEWTRVDMIEVSPHDPATGISIWNAVQVRRQQAVPVQDDGLRRDLEVHHRQSAAERLYALYPRG